MCDLTAIDETAFIGIGSNRNRHVMPDIIYRKLCSSIGLTRAMEITLPNFTLNAKDACQIGLVTKISECGTGRNFFFFFLLFNSAFLLNNFYVLCIYIILNQF